MTDSIRSTPSRGFTCAVSRADTSGQVPAIGGVAIGFDGDGDDRRIAISCRHADGTMLVAYLSDALVDRFAHILAAAVEGDLGAPIGGIALVH